jgi:transposase-like protein
MRNTGTADEKFNIVMESMKSGIPVTELSRRNGIAVLQAYPGHGGYIII